MNIDWMLTQLKAEGLEFNCEEFTEAFNDLVSKKASDRIVYDYGSSNGEYTLVLSGSKTLLVTKVVLAFDF